MNLFQKIGSFFTKSEIEPTTQPEARSGVLGGYYGVSYNGEKNAGEIGPIVDYQIDYEATAMRSWQSMLESDVTRMVITRYVNWVIGSGLKLQSEPNEKALATEKINIGDSQEFSETIEARFSVFASSKTSSHNGVMNLYEIQKEAYKNACLNGDVLVILRLVGTQLKVQIIDGRHVRYPYGNEHLITDKGTRIINGIEFNALGEHVAYWVELENCKYQRIPAVNSLGLKTAWLVYGDRHRIDDHRGISKVVTVLETLAKTERYKEATVGSAEEVAKISYQIVHQQFSTGENPFVAGLAKAVDAGRPTNPATVSGEELANSVRATTNKQAINMPQGAEIKPMNQSKATITFRDFYMTLVECVCGVVNIPPDVALSNYNANFSASRAALKDWEHTLDTERYSFSCQFMQPIYDYFLHLNILLGKVQAEGYLVSFMQKNIYVYEAYRSARFVGASVPHIDPEKEVRAERLKLGDGGAYIPLTTVERATERVDGGNAQANIKQFAQEKKLSESLGMKEEIQPVIQQKSPE
jgi:capsid protein